MEAVLAGRILQRCRTRWLSEVRGARRALLVGEGNGRFLEAGLAQLPQCRFVVIDASPAMLAQALRRCARSRGTSRVTFHRADLRTTSITDLVPGEFDLVVTNYFLDCFDADELRAVIQNIRGAVARSAHWLVADFSMPIAGWRRRAWVVLSMAYTFFRLTTGVSARCVTVPDTLLWGTGFKLLNRQTANAGLIHADLWARGDLSCSRAAPDGILPA
jgi:ubiquinone/menaquinone biosynthesis C-methylase UbiE